MKIVYAGTEFEINSFNESSYQDNGNLKSTLDINLTDASAFDGLIDLIKSKPEADFTINVDEESEAYRGYSFTRGNKSYYKSSSTEESINRNANLTFTK